ncbi:hypothetical protein MQC88_00225 [Luteimonas sp. 50]|uniref:Meckel syndrome type 1 protein n=1 Tax=Cognatiluteimonas sedimenti TaxID=2927791 RepID=A0ABT0A085_9GAMM|nr:hypothetical protein [Lysobacter sedimenti]MCJ0824399.1 hypothetical protein [Lysobacter sedimenti]
MTPQDPTSLDPQEHALAQRLSRVGPHGEPSPALDSRILATAHAAVTGHRDAGPRRSRRWPLGLGVAASLALALGLAWQLRPLPQVAPAYRSEADSALRNAPAAASPGGAATDAAPPPAAIASAERVQGETAAAALPPPASAGKPGTAAAKSARPPAPPPPPAPAPAAPPQEAPIVFDAPASMQARPAPEPANTAKAAATAQSRAADTSAASPSAAAPQAFGTARTAAEAQGSAADTVAMPTEPARQQQPAAAVVREDMPLEDVPPATVASPEVRDAWLARIRELVAGGKLEDARASLREFQHRYPDYPLPEDLRTLLP